MVRSILDKLSKKEMAALKHRLCERQERKCYISGEHVDLAVHKTDVDHIIALAMGGLDNETNFGLALSHHNRSKGIRDLNLQRIIYTFRKDLESKTDDEDPGTSLTVGDVLDKYGGSTTIVRANKTKGVVSITYELPNGEPCERSFPLIADENDENVISFMGKIQKECIFHQPEINPRSIVDLEPLIEEFYNKHPQLQPSLANLITDESGFGKIELFDGQHKGAAQLYLGNDELLVRVFFNCDEKRLKETNFRAHTKLAQIHFPQLIEDKVGDALFSEAFETFKMDNDINKVSEYNFDRNLSADERSEFKRFFNSHLRYEVLSYKRRGLLDYVETVSPRSKKYPLSYDTLRKFVLDRFLYLKYAKKPIAITSQYRQKEKENLVRLMDLIVEVILEKKYEIKTGIGKIEQKLATEPSKISDNHLRAYRLCRAPAIANWGVVLRDSIVTLLKARNKYLSDWGTDRYLWVDDIDEDDWAVIKRMVEIIHQHKLWIERDNKIVSALSSTKIGDWKNIIYEGKLPDRDQPFYAPLVPGYVFNTAVDTYKTR